MGGIASRSNDVTFEQHCRPVRPLTHELDFISHSEDNHKVHRRLPRELAAWSPTMRRRLGAPDEPLTVHRETIREITGLRVEQHERAPSADLSLPGSKSNAKMAYRKTFRSVILLFAELARQDVHVLDHRRLGQELVGSLHQPRSDRPSEMGPRPGSSRKTSKMPNVDGPIRIANHAVVASSCWASGSAPSRKRATSSSFPGLASSRARTPTVTMAPPWSASSANVPFR